VALDAFALDWKRHRLVAATTRAASAGGVSGIGT
jgi:hypothetical protein